MKHAAGESSHLGARIRDARLRAGLTQAELAGEIVSPSYLSRLEAGERAPSGETLDSLAAALGVTVNMLRTGQDTAPDDQAELAARVDHAELLLAGGELEHALAIAADVLGTHGLHRWSGLVERTRLVRGLVFEAQNDLTAAIMELEQVVDRASSDGQPSIPATIALSRCYRESGEYGLAISCGQQVLDRLAELGLAGTTEAIRLSVTVAGAQTQSGHAEVATRTCLRALEAAEQIKSPEAAAAAYWNAGIALRHVGDLERAHDFAARAMSLLENGDSTRNLGRLHVTLVLLKLRLREVDLAEVDDLLDLAQRELHGSCASAIDLANFHQAVARLRLRRRDFTGALEALAQMPIEQVADRRAEMGCETSVLRAVILMRAAEFPVVQVQEAVSRADADLRLLGRQRVAGQLWFELGAAAREYGDTELALTAFVEAATTLGAAVPVFQVLDSPAFSLPSAAGWLAST